MKSEIYAIVTEPESDNRKIWKQQLVDWVIFPHKDRPGVSGQCLHHPDLNLRETAQQTDGVTVLKHGCRKGDQENHHISDMCFDSDGTSLNLTTSSCVTCSNFSSTDICAQQKRPFIDVIKAKTAKLTIPKTSSSSEDLKEDEGVWASEEIKDEDSTRSSILKYAENDQISLTAISDDKPEGTRDAALEVSVVKVESEQFEIGEAFTVMKVEEAVDKYDENSIDLQIENQIDSDLSPENEAQSETISPSAN